MSGLVLALGMLVSCLGFYCLGGLWGREQRLRWTPRLVPFFIFPLLAVLSVLFSRASWHCLFGNPARSDGLLLVVAGVLAFLGVCGMTREKKQGKRFVFMLLAGGCIVALAILCRWGFRVGSGELEMGFAPGPFLATLLPLGLGLFWEVQRAAARVLLLAACVILFLALCLAGGGLAWLGFLAGWGFLFARRAGSAAKEARRVRNWWIVSAVAFTLVLLGFAVLALVRQGSPLAASGELVASAGVRFPVWCGAVMLIMHSPAWGHGPGLFYCLFPRATEPALSVWRERWAFTPPDACSGFLETGVAFGIPALLLLLVMFYVAYRASGRSAPFVAAPLVSVVVIGFFYSWDLVTSLLLWSLWGLALCSSSWNKRLVGEYYSIVEVRGSRRRPWNAMLFWVVLLVPVLFVLGWMLTIVRADLCCREARREMLAGRGAEAVELGWKGLLCQPYLPHLYLQQAEMHARTGLPGKWGLAGWREAELLLQRVWELNPLDPVSHARLARLYLELYHTRGGDWHLVSALRQNNLALACAPQDFHLMLDRVEMLFLSKDYDKVDKACAKVKALFPRAGQPYSYSAHLAMRRGDYSRAVDELERGVRLEWHGDDGGRADLYSNLAKIYCDRGALEKALERVRMAVALDPSFHDARYNLGWILKKLGRRDEAALAWRELLQMNPEHEMARRGLEKLGVSR